MNINRRHFTIIVLVLGGCAITPQPYSESDIKRIAEGDEELIYRAQEPIEGPLTLDNAMARALKYNLDNRVKLLEETVADTSLDLTRMDMLPMVAVSTGYFNRNNVDASRSVSVLTQLESLEPSTSQEKERHTRDLRFTWNLLDFGVSYLQAKQDADRYLMARQLRQKVMVTLLNDVRSAYWKAAAMASMREDLAEVSGRVELMLQNLQTVREEQLKTPLAILNDIRLLIETSQQLNQIKQAVSLAETQLATLINVPLGTKINIRVPSKLQRPPSITTDVDSLEMYALTNSADYSNEVYRVRVDQTESRKALLRLLPGLEFSYGYNYNSNRFLYNDTWGEAGFHLTGDLMRLINAKRIKRYNQANEELSISRRLAVNMAVIAGVHLSWQEYQNAKSRFSQAELLQQIDQEIASLAADAEKQEAGSGVEALQNSFKAFRSEMAQMLSYAESQEALGSLLVSVGVNPVPPNYQSLSVDGLSTILNQNFKELTSSMLLSHSDDPAKVTQHLNELILPDSNQALVQGPMPLCRETGCRLSEQLKEQSVSGWK